LAFDAWDLVQTQQNVAVGMGGALYLGLRYEGCQPILDANDLDRADIWDGLCIIEAVWIEERNRAAAAAAKH